MILWAGANVDVRDLRNYWAPGLEGLQQRNFDIGPGYDNGSFDYNNPYFILYEICMAITRIQHTAVHH